MALTLRTSAVSDIGRSRRKNDDSGYAGPHLVMVADGMGGAAAGDLASAVAVRTMQRLDAPAPDDLLEALAGAVHRANDRLAELIDEDSAVEGMGTTVTAALFDGQRIGVAHIGDSRGYLWRDGELMRITQDHTWVQSLIDEGRLTEDEARTHSHRSLLLKVLDGRHDNDPDLTLYDVQAGDRILICSDGLSGFVPHERIERVLSIGTADSAAQELTQLALEAGSTDNVTVVVADVVVAVSEAGDVEDTNPGLAPIIVGAAAEHPKGPFSRLRTWASRDEITPGEALLPPDVDPEALRYAPREPKRHRWLVRGIFTLVVFVVVAAAGSMAYGWSQSQYYVAASDGRVAIYQGIQARLPGIDLHHVYEEQDLSLDELPNFRRSQVLDGLTADDLDDARRIVSDLESMAQDCATQPSRTASAPTKTRPTGKTPTGPRSTKRPSATATPSTTPATGGTDNRPSAEECSGATPQTETSR